MTSLVGIAARRRGVSMTMPLLALSAIGSIALFMTAGLRGDLFLVLELRGLRLATMIVVGTAIAVSTVAFQTVTANRILTPSIMGLDALYVLTQTVLVFALSGLGFASIDPLAAFSGNFIAMSVLALALLLPMLNRRFDLMLMLLTGVVMGVLFRSLTSFVARLIDPNDFAVLQGAVFADFSASNPLLLVLTSVITLASSVLLWRARHTLDIIALGREPAIGLGIAWQRTVTTLLLMVAMLTAAATALVGPVAFLGLLVVALARWIGGSDRHAVLLPGSILVSILVLVGGQTILQHGLGGSGTLGIVVEFVGGLVFLVLLFSGRRA